MKRTTVFLDQGEFMGGAEYFLLDFLSSLSPTERRRLTPVILGGESQDYQAGLNKEITRIDFTLPAVKGGGVAKVRALWKLLWTAKRLKKELKNLEATQIFTNTPRAHLTVLMLKKIWGYKGQWLVMTHDFTTRPHYVVQQLGAYADVVVANSLPTRAWLKKQLKDQDHSKLRLIENGVQTQNTPVAATELSTVLNLSRLDPRKGQQYFAEAADLLQDRNPDLQFCITGDSVKSDSSTTAYETDLKTFAKDRQLQNLSFKPSVNDPLKTMDQYDGFVFTPTEPETFGRVVIEALSRGKLVLAFDQTGPKEILQHYQRWLIKKYSSELPPCQRGTEGDLVNKKSPLTPLYQEGDQTNLLLVEPNNAMSLAERIAYFADNPDQVEKYTAHAAEFVAQNYSLAETKKRLLEVLLG